jgi:hypothetical protein
VKKLIQLIRQFRPLNQNPILYPIHDDDLQIVNWFIGALYSDTYSLAGEGLIPYRYDDFTELLIQKSRKGFLPVRQVKEDQKEIQRQRQILAEVSAAERGMWETALIHDNQAEIPRVEGKDFSLVL